ncbi:hypothetical protein BDK51DRAFT_42576 [Blyttiomyces helicus]|uniref:Uncharacterized protein n=1 Tax=Blyttiomyces helicus TaxID=388810 RepID=A0A4V1ISI6_9FUNG|nr:hypothetical protein BDK51DRAFT_42576 [Blyttiomyces helicus]|eukprot:RKO93687.1 hypothetical protein BDK51DRAFT_42576 [Blyttiomyces helicus]
MERQGPRTNRAIHKAYLSIQILSCILEALAAFYWESGNFHLACAAVLPLQELWQMVLHGLEHSWKEVQYGNEAKPQDRKLATAGILASEAADVVHFAVDVAASTAALTALPSHCLVTTALSGTPAFTTLKSQAPSTRQPNLTSPHLHWQAPV